MPDLLTLGRLAEAEFFEIVQSTAIVENSCGWPSLTARS